MGEHLSPESFMGGVLIAAIVTGSIVYWHAYLMWGKGRNATKVQLQAAQANEAAAQASEAMTRTAAAQDRAEYERKLAATRKAAENDREQDRAEYEQDLAATRKAAENDREQDRAAYEKELTTAREGYRRAFAEATWRSLSVGPTDWHDSLPYLPDGRPARQP